MGKTISLLNATKDKKVRHYIPHWLIKETWKNSPATKSYDRNKKPVQNSPVVSWLAVNWKVLGSNPGGRNILAAIFFEFFPIIFFWVFSNGFVFTKKFLWLHQDPVERRVGPHMTSARPQVACKTVILAKFGQFRGIWCQNTFLTFFGLKNHSLSCF